MWKREQFANKGGDGALEVPIVRKESRMRISLDSYVVIGVISVIIRIVKAGRVSTQVVIQRERKRFVNGNQMRKWDTAGHEKRERV